MGSVALVFGYGRRVKYSVNVLVGAIEQELGDLVDVFVAPLKVIPNLLAGLIEEYGRGRVIYGQTLITTELPEAINDIVKAVVTARRLGAIPVAGGPHATGDPYGTLLSLGFEYVFMGDSEESFTRFLREIVEGGDPKSVRPGLAYIDEEEFIVTGKGRVCDLDRFPAFALKHRLFNPIEVTRGCPHACRYCQVSYAFGARYRHRSIDNIIRHAELMVSKGIRDLRFISPNALGYGARNGGRDLSKVAELLGELQKLRARGARVFFGAFPSEVRPEFVDREAALLLKESVDNRRVIVGAQSGSNRMLKELHRGHTAEDVTNAVIHLRSAGFDVDVDYIFGLPRETEEDVRETLEHIRELIRLGARVHAHVFLPLPGTPYSFEKPGEVSEWLRKELFKLLGKGAMYGQWEAQERLAASVARLRDLGVIIITRKRAQELISRFGGVNVPLAPKILQYAKR